MNEWERKLTDRFIRYCKVDTQSQPGSSTAPSTLKQLVLAEMLCQELKDLGTENAYVGKGGVVYATIPANTEGNIIPIGFNGHYDTTPDASGTDVKPWVYENYPGTDVVLNKEKNIVLELSRFPAMVDHKGEDMVFTDGTTLLGGDDKSAVAAIMTAVEYFYAHPEIKHGEIHVAFTPDEEVGRGAENFDVENFGAKILYILDGYRLGSYFYESFNGAEAQLTFKGLSVHPGSAKDKMINVVEIAGEFMDMLPALERPQFTEGKEGYYHPFVLNATVENAFIRCLVRDHDKYSFENRKAYVVRCVEALNKKYGAGTVTLEWVNPYSSMEEAVMKVPFCIDYLEQAMDDLHITKHKTAIRGGTDGCWLSAKGLPSPGLAAGFENAHGVYECASVQQMFGSSMLITRIAEVYAEHAEK